MTSLPAALKTALGSPWLPFWLVVALLPFGRGAESGTFLCTIGTVWLLRRHPDALRGHAGARLLFCLLACYVGAALLSAFGAAVPAKSWTTVAALLRYVPLGLYACLVVRRGARLQALYLAIAAVIALWVADAWMQMLTGWSLRGQAEAERISGIFGAQDLKLGPSLAVLSPFALAVARSRWGMRGLVIGFLLILGPVLLAGSRAAWLCYALVALAFAWREAASPQRFAALCGLGALALALGGGVAWKISTRFDARMERTLAAFNGSAGGLNEALSGRLDIWRTSARMIAAHPFTGVGVRDFRYAYPRYAPANDHFVVAESCGDGEGACHAHQIVLEILTETGAIGLALWLVGAALAWRAWRRAGATGRANAFPASLALGVMLFPLNTHLAFYSAWWGLLFAWLLGLWCASLFAAGFPVGLLEDALSREARDGT